MYELLYTSVSPEGLSESELKDLLDCGREFMQLLEGEEDVVQTLFQTISEDWRHRSVEVFYEGTIENRAFTDWSMAFKVMNGSEFGKLVMGYEEFSRGGSPLNILKDSPNRGKKAFLALRETL